MAVSTIKASKGMYICSDNNWRSYSNATDALSANRSLFATDGAYIIPMMTSGGSPSIAILHKGGTFIHGILQSYMASPVRIYSQDSGATWTT